MKKLTKVILASGSAAALIFGAALPYIFAAQQRSYNLPNDPPPLNCPMGGNKGGNNNPGGPFTGPTQVNPVFDVVASSYVGQEKQFVTLRPSSLEATTYTKEVGIIRWELVPDDETPLTTVNGPAPFKEYPATVDIYVRTRATLDSHPGVVYESKEPVHLKGSNVTHFNPFNPDARFDLASPVVFQNPENPDDDLTLDEISLGGE